MGSCAAPSAKGDDKFITTDYLQQCLNYYGLFPVRLVNAYVRICIKVSNYIRASSLQILL
ncbi:hypothetical protein BTT35_24860 [Salmonella enterica subsp. enterica serovar Kentucky]|nr:hypothetical protein [Salmonella enterica subsp. enterica serovar Kentucky]ECS6971264.1 hypothetical protein [Salmonella enterica subsp. enterica serovar Kentucky]EDK5520111.1 hypothetical protein [Salmonella enterica subsp. enterica serovar Kentucky]